MVQSNEKIKVILDIEGTESKIESFEKFEHSYYQNEYLQTFHIITSILEAVNEKTSKGIRGKNSSYTQIHNIIPFMGKRGTGKTSVMLSFAQFLKEFSGNMEKYESFFLQNEKNEAIRKSTKELWENTGFYCLDLIDGSLLEQGEDLFKITLAQMYGSFLEQDQHGAIKDETYEYEVRDLQLHFDKIYRNICQLENSKGEESFEESPITSLKNLSSSLKLKTEFEQIVQKYIAMLCRGKQKSYYAKKENRYLVVIIDDLDLNIDKGFDMLEKIHRYMMIPNVIVLTAVDYDQLLLLCQKNFYKMIPKFDKLLIDSLETIEQLSQDFLDKILPSNVRIYMPALTRREDIGTCIDEKSVSLKKALFWEIYKKLGMRFDIEGIKRHFFEQDNMRSYVNFYLMLDNMDELSEKVSEEEKRSFLKVFERNYRQLLYDTVTRVVDERLRKDSKKLFREFTNTQLPRSMRNVFSYISKTDVSDGGELEQLVSAIRFYDYSYGEIMRIIYCWGRVDSDSKEIIRCLLAYFSMELTRSFYRYCYLENGEQKDEEKNDWCMC